MKKLLFSAVTLDVGGIETALVTLLNYLASEKLNNKYKYEITLVLEKKQGLFLDVLDKNIKIIKYTPNNNKIVLLRKGVNLVKQQIFKIKHKNKYDFSCSFATYSNPGAFIARNASKNSCLWCHMNYLSMFNNDKEKVKEFFDEKNYKEFKNIVFVSQESKDTFLQVFPKEKDKTIYINNLIDYNKILKSASEEVADVKKDEEVVTFINVGRHDEEQKKLSRIIKASKMLKENNKKFKVIFIGDGKDTNFYKDLVKKYNLENEILFLGRKKNPYPYFKLSDCTILTSDYEGYPVVFVESMILNKPIITTKVSGVEAVKKEKYAIITNEDIDSIYKVMEEFIEKGFKIENKFNPEKYNNEIISKIEKML